MKNSYSKPGSVQHRDGDSKGVGVEIREYIKQKKLAIDKELERLLPSAKERPQIVHKAMRYSIKGGKRIRPMLCIASAEAAGGTAKQALKTACAIEMIHAYSLVHDDLPSMDNDDYRRGRLSCHKKFGVANAVLAGDALLTLAFNTLSTRMSKPDLNFAIMRELSQAAGSLGMIGGQALDISTKEKDMLTLEYININKTGALIASSCKVGGILAQKTKKEVRSLFRFGEYIGVAFQIVDDILDSDGLTKLIGPERAYRHAARLTKKAKQQISYLGPRAKTLNSFADLILKRKR